MLILVRSDTNSSSGSDSALNIFGSSSSCDSETNYFMLGMVVVLDITLVLTLVLGLLLKQVLVFYSEAFSGCGSFFLVLTLALKLVLFFILTLPSVLRLRLLLVLIFFSGFKIFLLRFHPLVLILN